MNGLKCIRKICNLSASDLADLLDVSRQAISLWENGKTIPEDRLKQLSNYFGVKETYFGEITDNEKEELLSLPMVRADFNGKEAYRFRKEEDIIRSWEELFEKFPDPFHSGDIDRLVTPDGDYCNQYPFSDGETSLEEEYSLAQKEKKKILKQIDKLIDCSKSRYKMDHTAAIKCGCRSYGMFNELVENDKRIPRYRDSLYELEYNSVLKAMLLAYDLIDTSELYYRKENEVFEEDGKWIEELSEIIKNHWRAQLSAHDKLNIEVFGPQWEEKLKDKFKE